MERLFTMPPDLELNWGQQSGPLNHSSHELQLTSQSNTSFASLFDELWHFQHFGEGNNLASVYIKELPPRSGTWYAFFDSKGMFGWLSDWINDSEVSVRIWRQLSNKTIVGDTCGKHMLVGQRRWSIKPAGAYSVVVKTESYDYARGWLNRLGSKIGGGIRLQKRVWKDYFKDIQRIYDPEGISQNGTIVCQQNWVESKECSWLPPDDKYPGKEIP
jgi:hypothetical protein